MSRLSNALDKLQQPPPTRRRPDDPPIQLIRRDSLDDLFSTCYLSQNPKLTSVYVDAASDDASNAPSGDASDETSDDASDNASDDASDAASDGASDAASDGDSDDASDDDSDATSDDNLEATANSPIVVHNVVSGEQEGTTLGFVRRDSLDKLLSMCDSSRSLQS